ncbi:MAG: tetratricopeptide repeat protein, partial [Mameliella sp.]|nr:tetratricopeptide repeat protein [Phaeodactylibacter sp.]
AEYYYNTSIDKYDALQDSTGMLRSMNNLLELKRENNDLSGSLAVLRSIYEFYLRHERLDNAANTLEGIGVTLSEMGLHNEAFEAYQQVFELGQKNGHKRNIHSGLIGLSNVEVDRANYKSAKGYLTKALDYFENEANDVDNVARIYVKLGTIYTTTSQYDSAAYYYTRILRLADSLSYQRFRPRALLGLGEVSLYQGNIEEAQRITAQLAALSSTFSEDNQRYSYYTLEGQLRFKLKDYSGAIPYLSDTYASDIERKNLFIALDKAEKLLESHKALNQPAKALEYAEAINWITDSLIQQNDLEKLAEQRKDFEFQLERQKMEIEQAREAATLKAQATQNLIIGIGGIALAALGFGFFWNTRRKNKTIALQNSQLQQLNETKDRLFAIIGHDLRKPAIAFRGIAKKVNFLLRKKDFATLEQLGEEIEQDATGLSQLTENLLNWALTQRNVMPYQPTKLKLLPLLEDTAAPFQTVLQNKQIDLEWAIPEGTVVFSDANALSTIVRNLLDNAIKFTPEGGQISLEGNHEENLFKLKVRDTGVGIPSEKLKELFLLKERRTQPGTAGEKGSGLGLHLAHELSKLNQSSLAVSSQIGKGTIFTLNVPLSAT